MAPSKKSPPKKAVKPALVGRVAPNAPKKAAPKKVAKPAPAKKAPPPKKPAKKPAKVVGRVAPNAPKKESASAKPAPKTAAPAPKPFVRGVPPRIVKKAPPPSARPAAAKSPSDPFSDTAKAVAFAMSIAQEMKRSAKNEDEKRSENEIRLSRRPTTRTQGSTSIKFPDADLADFRRRLIEARANALSGVDAMKATGFNESDDREADGGDGTNQTLRLQALGQMGAINRTIQQIEEALHRIDDGTYGVCTVCGQLIRKPRLLNQPFVLTCMECQSEMERQRN